MSGYEGLISKAGEGMSSVFGGLMGKGEKPEIMSGSFEPFATGNGEQIMMPDEYDKKMQKFGKQAASDKSTKNMMQMTQAAQQISQPGQSFVDMGGLLGLGRQQMGDSQQQAMALAGNSNAKMYQKMLLQQMMGGGNQ